MTFERSNFGLYLPEEYIRKPKARPVAVDLFAGCGGMSLGLIKAGWDVIAALEIMPEAIVTYLTNLGAYPVRMIFLDESDRERMTRHLERAFKMALADKSKAFDGPADMMLTCGGLMSGSNRPHVAPDFEGVKYMFVGDARKLTGEMILQTIGMEAGDLDLVCGGPPCQGFSRSGKQNIMDPRNSLVIDFARLIVEMQPKTMLFENVPGILDMVTPEGIPVLDAVSKILADGNFGEYDALRKCLAETAGCGAALKGGRGTGKGLRATKERHALEIDRPAESQATLF